MTRSIFPALYVVAALSSIGSVCAQGQKVMTQPMDPTGKWPYPEKQYHNDRTLAGPFMRKLRRIRAAEGNDAAAARIPAAWDAYAKRRLEPRWKNGWNIHLAFDGWGFWVWHEAQFDTGKDDPEWALLLYKSIYDIAKTQKRFDWTMHVRASLVVSYSTLCQWANARAVLNKAEDYYKGIGFDLDPNKLPAQGDWDAKVPFVKTRDFPVILPNGRAVIHWQRSEERKDASKPIHIDNILTGLMQELAYEDHMMGRWDRAIERGIWLRKWSNAVNNFNADKNRKYEVKRVNEDTYRAVSLQMASIMVSLGFTEKALGLIEEGLARKPATMNDLSGRTHLEILKARLLVEYGKENAALDAKMDEAIAREGKSANIQVGSMDTARIVKSQCLVTMGKVDEAEALLRTITARQKRTIRGWLTAELALIDIMLERSEFSKAESTLRELMDALRITGVKIDELNLYRSYVKWGIRSGNWEAALRAQREVMRLVDAFRMTPIVPLEQATLSRIMAELGDQAESDRLAALARAGAKGRETRFVEKVEKELAERPGKQVATKKSRVLVQPKRVMSVPLDGFPARAVVSLVNYGGKQAKGVLKIKGLPAKISWDDKSGSGVIEVENAPGNAVERASETIYIEAGAMAIFSCSGKLANQVSKTVFLEWVENGEGASHCEWIIGAADKESDGAVVDAAEYGDDPFFLIPIYHHLQCKSNAPVNLRVVASQPCRVEMYDEAGALQMVDAEGNGSLAESGDWLGMDRDRNLAAEALPDTATGETRFLLQLDPKDWKGKDPLRIRVEWLVDGKWYLAAENQIVSGK
jgi:hypothetical protein